MECSRRRPDDPVHPPPAGNVEQQPHRDAGRADRRRRHRADSASVATSTASISSGTAVITCADSRAWAAWIERSSRSAARWRSAMAVRSIAAAAGPPIRLVATITPSASRTCGPASPTRPTESGIEEPRSIADLSGVVARAVAGSSGITESASRSVDPDRTWRTMSSHQDATPRASGARRRDRRTVHAVAATIETSRAQHDGGLEPSRARAQRHGGDGDGGDHCDGHCRDHDGLALGRRAGTGVAGRSSPTPRECGDDDQVRRVHRAGRVDASTGSPSPHLATTAVRPRRSP